MTWTAGATKATGDLITAAIWNGYLGATGSIGETAPAKVTTQGDTIYATAANTLARLAKGLGDQRMKMNTAATAPSWGGVYDMMMQTFCLGNTVNYWRAAAPGAAWTEPSNDQHVLLLRRQIDFARIPNQALARLSAIVYMDTGGAERARAGLHNLSTGLLTNLITAYCSAAATWELVQSSWVALPDRTTEDNLGIRVYASGSSGGESVRLMAAWIHVRCD
ncbi:MAG: hypothetical protein Q7J84_03995 [Sulfuricaulis sp.]|nr:hypothetical protein [Sulfuricaulis sp.]